MAEPKDKGGQKPKGEGKGGKQAGADDAKAKKAGAQAQAQAQPKQGKGEGKAAPEKKAEPQKAREPLPAELKTYVPRLKKRYVDTIRPALMQKFGYKNMLQAPKLDKVVLNMGVGETVTDTKKAQAAARDMMLISGQKPIVTKARKSIATFKVREGMPIGVKVTLRRDRMYEFVDRLVTMALPRVRDFRGLNGKSFDGRGNFAMGLKEHIVFPEIDFDKVEQVWGMDIIICTTAKSDAEAKELLRGFQFPFIETGKERNK